MAELLKIVVKAKEKGDGSQTYTVLFGLNSYIHLIQLVLSLSLFMHFNLKQTDIVYYLIGYKCIEAWEKNQDEKCWETLDNWYQRYRLAMINHLVALN